MSNEDDKNGIVCPVCNNYMQMTLKPNMLNVEENTVMKNRQSWRDHKMCNACFIAMRNLIRRYRRIQ